MKLISLTLLLSFVGTLSLAQENDSELYELSLEELLSVNVESATKSSLTIQRAPSVIRVYTQQDIQLYNFVDLQDLLLCIPGTQIQQYRAGHQLTWIRGVQARYNNKVLLMIDGVPIRDSYYGNFNIDEMIPIEMIDKVEVINGPGSVLYGANSFSGVISVTTKKAGKQVGIDFGSFNTFSGHAEFDVKNFYAHVGYFQTDGFEPALKSNGLSRDIPQDSDNLYGYLKYQDNNFKGTFGFMDYSYSYKYRSTDKDYSYKRMPFFGSLRYDFNLGEDSQLGVNAYINEYKFTRSKIKFIDDVSDSLREISDNSLDTRIYGADIEYSLNKEKHDLIAGFSLQVDQAVDVNDLITFDEGEIVNELEQTILDENVSRSNSGFFIQDVWSVSDNWRITAGLRYDIQSKFNNQFNYRVGFTGSLTDNLYTKFLYGTAYRVPAYREYIDAEAPNLELKPETLQTAEAQFGYLLEKADLNVTFYNNSYSDFISEIVVDSMAENGGFRVVDDEMSFNFESRNITGLELNAIMRPTNKLSINSGASFILSATQEFGGLDVSVYTNDVVPEGKSDITFLSSSNLFLLFNYRMANSFSFGVNAVYFGDRNVPSNYQNDVPAQNRDLSNSDGFLKTDLVLIAKPIKKLTLNLKVNNIFNSEFYSPPFGGSADYDAEWPGINFRIAAIYSLIR